MNLGISNFLRGPFNQETVEKALRHLTAGIVGGWSVQHDHNGAHTDITARSLRVTQGGPQSGDAGTGAIELVSHGETPAQSGTATFSNTRANGARIVVTAPDDLSRAADLTVECVEKIFGAGTAAITVLVKVGRVSGGAGTGASGAGLELDSRELNGGQWSIVASDDNLAESLGFFDVADALEVLKLYRRSAGVYCLQPSEDGIATVKLGDHTDSDFVFDECAAFSYYEGTRAAALGHWTDVAYAAGNFTASAGAWTVDAGDQQTYSFSLVGTTMTLAWSIISSDVSAGSVLRLAIPGGLTAAQIAYGTYRVSDAGAAHVIGLCRVLAGDAYVELYPTAAGGAFAITAADNTQVQGTFTFEVA